MERNRGGRPRHPDILTPAEWRVLEQLREGGTNGEIASRLGVSANAVKYHISNMLAKLELPDRRELAAWRPDHRRRRLRAVFAVPAAAWSLARPLLWVGVGTAAVVGAAAALVAGVAAIVVALIVLGGPDDESSVAMPPPTATQSARVTTVELRVVASLDVSTSAHGLLEIRIQQRGTDGEWFEYDPRQPWQVLWGWSFFLTNHAEQAWFVTQPQAVSRPGAEAWPVMVRVAARRLPGGLIEFALEKHEPGEGWGERLLPDSRSFPANAASGHGLATSPLQVPVPSPAGNQPVSRDRAALAALFVATGGLNWQHNTNWIGEGPISEWHGVTVDGSGRVTALELRNNRLAGPLPDKLGELGHLRTLDLGGNWLSGPIPASLGRLTSLERIDFHGGDLRGSGISSDGPSCAGHLESRIPAELGRLANLRYMDLSCNELTGTIPPELGNLGNLETLILDINLLESLPTGLGRLTNLRTLSVSWNWLNGNIPSDLGSLTSLESLHLGRNWLSGPIPPELGNLTNLTELYLYDNSLSGTIPPALGNLPELKVLHLSANELTGAIPAQLGHLSNLEWLALNYNRLSGPIPPELGDLASLRSLWLGSNRLVGGIPAELGRLHRLESLSLHGNELTGCLPKGLQDFAEEDLDLQVCPD